MAAKTVVGLEITEESVRALEVTTGGEPTILAFAEIPLPEGAAKDSEVLDRDAVVVALQQLWAQLGTKTTKVVLGVGSRRILVREHITPLVEPSLIKAALPFQVADLLPVPVDQAVLDFYPVEMVEGGVQGLLVAAVSETMEDLVDALGKAKLYATSIDLVPFGLARASKLLGQPGEATVMVHVTEHTTYVVVAVDGVPQFVRIVPAEIPTTATERRRKVEILATEPVEVAVVSGGGRAAMRIQNGQQAGPGAASATAASDLATRIRSTVEFYFSRRAGTPVGGILVSGAGAANPAIVPALESALDRPVRVADVNLIARSKPAQPEGEIALNLFSTLGIVLGEGKQ